jgi:TetR/AcrR family transcriptional regulator of autoinduction and epiphytic fitness
MVSKQSERRAQQRVRILEAAHELFAQHGFEEVTVADVAAEAGVARATVFNHFGSKHALVEALTEAVFTFYEAMLEAALADEGTRAPSLVRALFEQMGAGIAEDRRFYRGVFREMARVQFGFDEGGPGHRANERTQSLLAKLLQRGQERGELSAAHQPETLASAFNSLVNGTITHWLYDDSSDSLRERMRAAAEVLLGAVEAGGAASSSTPLPDLTPPRAPTDWDPKGRK